MNSPATDAGLRLRDIILKVNGTKVTSAQDTLTRIANIKPGKKVQITGVRDDGPFALDVQVSERPRAE